jgi:hypothetical protein
MLRNKKYGMGGAVQSFSSPMLAQGMQGGLSGFGTSGLGTFANGGQVGEYENVQEFIDYLIGVKEMNSEIGSTYMNGDYRKSITILQNLAQGKKLNKTQVDYLNFLKNDLIPDIEESRPMTAEDFSYVLKFSNKLKNKRFAKGGEIINQYEGRTPADIWFNLSKSQRRHLLLDHANIPSGEISMYVGYDTNYEDLPHFVKQIVKKHFAEGQYAKGGQIASIGDSGIITDKNSMFVGKMATITGDLGNMFEVRVGGRTTMVKKNGIRIVSDEYADGGKTRKSGNVPKIAKKVAEVNALIEKGNELGLEVVDSSTTWQAPMKYKPIKYVNGILYIEYEELDLYLNNRRGINQWKLKKDKVLKRNMEFDNPLNDIARMYRKAIREREQYFANGGDVEDRDRFSSARMMGRDSQNWEQELKQYAGEDYKSLTPREREEIIADMQKDWHRNTHFAKGGEVENQNMDVQFIEYKGNEIMFEPHYKKYYANDVEFNSLKDAQKFLDSGKISNDIRGAYRKGLFADGGETSSRNKEIAQTILNQLGGMNRLIAFTGAYNFVAINNGVSFRIKNPKANYIKITLNGKDLYDLEVGRIRGTDYKVVGKQSDLYYDMLKSEIEKFTGMYLSFAKGGKIGFEGLATKVAKRYVGKKVSKEYQAEYGKTYDAKEAKEVGNKVAGKVYQQQVAKKKIVRKLQRKTN